MKSLVVNSFGQPAALQSGPQPWPESGEVLIRVAAAAVNFADLLLLKGSYQDTPALPFCPGLEFSGRIAACGPGVDPALAGKRIVAYGGQGGFAEYACVAADRCIPIPDNLAYGDAAALQVAWGTSDIALHDRAAVRAGETLLVLGGGGGVGLAAVAMGKILGARVIAAARGNSKLEAARAAGADHLIDTDIQDLREAVLALGRADIVFDPVGGALSEAAFRVCKPEARFLLIGFASGDIPEIRLNHALVKNISLIGVNWSGYWQFAPDRLIASGTRLVALAAGGRISANIGHRLPLDQVAEALELLRTRQSTGKVIVEPGPQDL